MTLDELELAFEEDHPRGHRHRHRPGERRPVERRPSGRRSGRGRQQGRHGRSFMALLVSLVILGMLALGGWYGFTKVQGFLTAPDYTSPGSGEVAVQVQPDQSATDIAHTLYVTGVVKSAKAFVEAARANPQSKEIQPGMYQLQLKMPATDALILMLDPKSRLIKTVTIPEGTTYSQAFELLAARTGIPATEFQTTAADPAALGVPEFWLKRSDGKRVIKSLEGFLFPATYEFQPGVTAEQVLRKMVAKFLEVADSLKLAQNAQAKSITPFEALINASLVEAEAGIAADMPKVSRVIYNRLNNKPDVMPLEFDATTNYWLTLKGLPRKDSKHLSSEELHDPNNPYSTTVELGLPPGPIGNPGEAALRAALTPEPGAWLYFVVIDKTGRSAFANTLPEHERNIDIARKNGVA